MARYKVIADTSTRASPDPTSPDYESWLYFEAGQTVTKWPEHTPVDDWVASGHWQPAKKSRDDEEEG